MQLVSKECSAGCGYFVEPHFNSLMVGDPCAVREISGYLFRLYSIVMILFSWLSAPMMYIVNVIWSSSGMCVTILCLASLPSGPGASPVIVIVFFSLSCVPSRSIGRVLIESTHTDTYFFFSGS